MEKDMNIYCYLDALINYALKNALIEDVDKIYYQNQIIALLGLDSYEESKMQDELTLDEILDHIMAYAIQEGIISDTTSSKDLFDTKIMSIFCERPSNVIKTFNDKYEVSPESATNWFYQYSKDVNYIRAGRIAKDIKWQTDTKYGTLDITINLSKPEKDPRDILKAKEVVPTNYPRCALCKENEGYKGRINHPARGNLRLIPIKLSGEQYYLQYSPYSYYNEHAIILSENHTPMIINKATFTKLLDFLDLLPHYFIGSNADLGIVGGSILSHDHFQGGRFTFPMDLAKSIYETKYKDIDIALLYWPLSVIRLKSKNKESLINLSDQILKAWIDYDNEALGIISHTDGVRHNTITPISRKINEEYIIDLVLRCNIQTIERPYGLFHPSEQYHHIKKENIGLIEVLGLAILPSRLKTELELIKAYILNNSSVLSPELEKHLDWINRMKKQYSFNSENIDQIFKDEVGHIFMELLEDCGVFKQTEIGTKEFTKFLQLVIK